MAKKKKDKESVRAADATGLETMVIASCLAAQLARNEYSVEASLATLEADVAGWRRLARAAVRALK